ncbi:MAG: hypothetical protein R3F58_01520 [Steroidobacteraceae bacterium]
MKRRYTALWSLIALTIAPIAIAQNAVDLTGRWRINGNGFVDDLTLQQATDGTVSGTLYGDPVTGYVAGGARQAILLRGPTNAPDQVYIASVSADQGLLSGTFYALNTANGGASRARNVFPFRAARGTSNTPPSPGPMPGGVPGPSRLDGTYLEFDANGFGGTLVLSSIGPDGAIDGRIDGPIYNGAQLRHGHFAAGTGTLAFARMANGVPFQVFVGGASGSNSVRLSGTFYPLNAAGGASQAKLQFPWSTGAAPQAANSVIVAPSAPGDVVRATRQLDCDGLLTRVYYGTTGTHVDVSTETTRAIRISQQPPVVPARNIRWECRNPGRTNVEVRQIGCPGMPATGGNSNVARILRTRSGETTLECVFRPPPSP